MNPYAERTYSEITDIRDQKKLDLLDKVIPNDVKTIIDIGCGNGLITNVLNKKYQVLGVDINASKLEYVEAPTLQSSCDKIDRADGDFDMVFSSEMLEHLPEDLYKRTLVEFERLAKNYILITVPYRESLEKLVVKCNSCGKNYHKNGHLRSFNEKTLAGAFSNFRIKELTTFGNGIRSYPDWLAEAKHNYVPPSGWIPGYWVKTMGVPYHFCIYCGAKNPLSPKFSPLGFLLDGFNSIFSPKYKSHLMVLFQRS
jgi:SAM-dependent methyltransferase